MARARLQKREVLIRKIPNVLRQLPIMQPELRSREVLQSGEHRPASKSSSTRFAAASNPPALLSSTCSLIRVSIDINVPNPNTARSILDSLDATLMAPSGAQRLQLNDTIRRQSIYIREQPTTEAFCLRKNRSRNNLDNRRSQTESVLSLVSSLNLD
jgi:hypothetical protein